MRRRFAAKDAVSWLVQAFLGRPALFEYAARRLAARGAVRATMGLVMGDLVPASRALDPRFLAALLARDRSGRQRPTPRPASGVRASGAMRSASTDDGPDPAVPPCVERARAGAWTLPGGGLDFGEHPEDAVVRELARGERADGRDRRRRRRVLAPSTPTRSTRAAPTCTSSAILYRVEVDRRRAARRARRLHRHAARWFASRRGWPS